MVDARRRPAGSVLRPAAFIAVPLPGLLRGPPLARERRRRCAVVRSSVGQGPDSSSSSTPMDSQTDGRPLSRDTGPGTESNTRIHPVRVRALDARAVVRASQEREEEARVALERLRLTSRGLLNEFDAAAADKNSLRTTVDYAGAEPEPVGEATADAVTELRMLTELLEGVKSDARALRKADLDQVVGGKETLARIEGLINSMSALQDTLSSKVEDLESSAQSTSSRNTNPSDIGGYAASASRGVDSRVAAVTSGLPNPFQREWSKPAESNVYDGLAVDDDVLTRASHDSTEWEGPKAAPMKRENVDKTPLVSAGVERVKENLVEGSNTLMRRASSIGADLEQKVSSIMKDDGSLDLDRLRSNVRSGIDRFGETWQRLNGLDPNSSKDEGATAPTTEAAAALVESPRDDTKIASLQAQIGTLEKELDEASKARELVLRREDQLGKLIRAKEIRAMDDSVSAVRRTLAVRVLQLEMESIFVSLHEEIEQSSIEFMEQRIMIAEFGDMDSLLASLADYIDQGEPGLIDDYQLGSLASDVQYMKVRLGLDATVYSTRFDITQLRQTVNTSLVKARAGLEFYIRGMRLFWGDCGYAIRFIRRVFVGYTLSPREVRTLRRTGRDLLTLIPFTIILIAPITPIGHVLVFGFIQRYWPDFFPSTFSERRQILMKRHEEYARSIREEREENLQGGKQDGTLGIQNRAIGLLTRVPLLGTVVANASRLGNARQNANSDDDDDDKGGSGGKPSSRQTADTISESFSDAAKSNGADVGSGGPRRRGRTAVALDDLHLAD